jgi:hypothetical protein
MPLASAVPRQCGGGSRPARRAGSTYHYPCWPACFPTASRLYLKVCFSLTKYPHSYPRPPFFIIRISILLRCVRVCRVHHTTLRVLTARETFGQFVSLQYSSQLLVILVSRASKSGSRPGLALLAFSSLPRRAGRLQKQLRAQQR